LPSNSFISQCGWCHTSFHQNLGITNNPNHLPLNITKTPPQPFKEVLFKGLVFVHNSYCYWNNPTQWYTQPFFGNNTKFNCCRLWTYYNNQIKRTYKITNKNPNTTSNSFNATLRKKKPLNKPLPQHSNEKWNQINA
jgi:hypothetical protein